MVLKFLLFAGGSLLFKFKFAPCIHQLNLKLCVPLKGLVVVVLQPGCQFFLLFQRTRVLTYHTSVLGLDATDALKCSSQLYTYLCSASRTTKCAHTVTARRAFCGDLTRHNNPVNLMHSEQTFCKNIHGHIRPHGSINDVHIYYDASLQNKYTVNVTGLDINTGTLARRLFWAVRPVWVTSFHILLARRPNIVSDRFYPISTATGFYPITTATGHRFNRLSLPLTPALQLHTIFII